MPSSDLRMHPLPIIMTAALEGVSVSDIHPRDVRVASEIAAAEAEAAAYHRGRMNASFDGVFALNKTFRHFLAIKEARKRTALPSLLLPSLALDYRVNIARYFSPH